MQTVLFVASLLFLLLVVHHVHCEEEKLASPKIPAEIKDYLKALSDYYAIVGRPRFGRSLSQNSLFSYHK